MIMLIGKERGDEVMLMEWFTGIVMECGKISDSISRIHVSRDVRNQNTVTLETSSSIRPGRRVL